MKKLLLTTVNSNHMAEGFDSPSEAINSSIQKNEQSGCSATSSMLSGSSIDDYQYSTELVKLKFSSGDTLVIQALESGLDFHVEKQELRGLRDDDLDSVVSVSFVDDPHQEVFLWKRHQSLEKLLGQTISRAYFNGTTFCLYTLTWILEFSVVLDNVSKKYLLFWLEAD